jgi:hypothetical protein
MKGEGLSWQYTMTNDDVCCRSSSRECRGVLLSCHVVMWQLKRMQTVTTCVVIVVGPCHAVHAVVVVDDEDFVYGR